ncbi:MAG: hypothetical protein HUU32_06055 [Calditrichaceae bacterium]|nr:hypothetical protein [Calditrichia bacterium]NUQ40940.1 hypothetical protein [Calditrichaceae bacterium]
MVESEEGSVDKRQVGFVKIPGEKTEISEMMPRPSHPSIRDFKKQNRYSGCCAGVKRERFCPMVKKEEGQHPE